MPIFEIDSFAFVALSVNRVIYHIIGSAGETVASAGTSHSGSKLSGGLKTGKVAKTDTKMGQHNWFIKKWTGLYPGVFICPLYKKASTGLCYA